MCKISKALNVFFANKTQVKIFSTQSYSILCYYTMVRLNGWIQKCGWGGFKGLFVQYTSANRE